MINYPGHKIFISYKYSDCNVCQIIDEHLNESAKGGELTVRDYVNVLEEYIEKKSSHDYKGEEDDVPLNELTDKQIWEKLKNDIFDSTLTIVLISPHMNNGLPEKEQWIPLEIRYSLTEKSRTNSADNTITSHTNAMLAIVLPDRNNSYSYYFEYLQCCPAGCRLNKTDFLFPILQKNTFNRIKDIKCRVCSQKSTIYTDGMQSYISFYKWCDVNSKEKFENAVLHAYSILSQKDKYKLCRELEG